MPIFRADTASDVAELLPDLSAEFHFIIADAPGGFQRTAETNLELLRHTDFALIPITPKVGNISPLPVVEKKVQQARQTNPLLEARIIINCVDGRTTAGKNIGATIADIQNLVPDLRVMRQTIRVDESAFERAAKALSVVVKGPRSNGREDLDAIFAELLSDMIVSINLQDQRMPTNNTELRDGKAAAVNE